MREAASGRIASRARAKVNLSLEVLGRRPDGYHELESLVAFARVADDLVLEPGPDLGLTVAGPSAAAAGQADDNLVLRAARALAERRPGLATGHFRLLKRLPVAAGLGGGSADAAAALRCLAELNGLRSDDPALHDAALATGSDVPVCLSSVARWMRGAGETLSAPLALPRLPAVLVNPGRPAATAPVFAGLGLAPGAVLAPPRETPDRFPDPAALISELQGRRNDLTGPAAALVPEIGIAIDLLADQPGCRLARMSGSGATSFGLFDTCRTAAAAARRLRTAYPDWWVVTTMLG